MTWKSFPLRRTPLPRDLEEFRGYARSWSRPAEQPDAGQFALWTSDNSPPTHSMPALIAGKAAASFGPAEFRAFHHRVLTAYFTENRTISDLDVLTEVAAQAGLDPTAFGNRLQQRWPDFEQEVLADYAEAIERGIDAIPATLVDDRYLISGAQELAVFCQAVEQALAEQR